MSIIGTCPRSFCRMLIHLWPCLAIGREEPGQSLPTYSSIVASVHRLQLVPSATSMIMFHFFIVLLPEGTAVPPREDASLRSTGLFSCLSFPLTPGKFHVSLK